MLREAIELRVPEHMGVGQPAADRIEGRGVELTALDAAVFDGGDQAGRLEHTQMLEDRRHRHVERLGELGDRRLAPGQPGQDGAPRRVGQRAEHRVQMSVAIHNHLVKYYQRRRRVSRGVQGPGAGGARTLRITERSRTWC